MKHVLPRFLKLRAGGGGAQRAHGARGRAGGGDVQAPRKAAATRNGSPAPGQHRPGAPLALGTGAPFGVPLSWLIRPGVPGAEVQALLPILPNRVAKGRLQAPLGVPAHWLHAKRRPRPLVVRARIGLPALGALRERCGRASRAFVRCGFHHVQLSSRRSGTTVAKLLARCRLRGTDHSSRPRLRRAEHGRGSGAVSERARSGFARTLPTPCVHSLSLSLQAPARTWSCPEQRSRGWALGPR